MSDLMTAGESYNKLPRWKKRLHGFIICQFNSWISIFNPEFADKVMYKLLKEQFE